MAKKEMQAVPTLSEHEARTLANQIKQGVEGLVPIMVRFREGKGWLALGYKTWTECCEQEFGFTRKYVSQLMRESAVKQECKTSMSVMTDLSGRQARELARVPKEDRPTVLREATKMAPKNKAGKPRVTAKTIREAAEIVNQPRMAEHVEAAIDEGRDEYRRIASGIRECGTHVRRFAQEPWGQPLRKCKYERDLFGIAKAILEHVPHIQCKSCQGSGCKVCSKRGWLTKLEWDQENGKKKGSTT